MTNFLRPLSGWLMSKRSRLPKWVVYLMEGVAKRPGALSSRMGSLVLGGLRSRNRPFATSIPDRPTRVYIAPTNYSGQGYLWARALESRDARIGARNLEVQLPGGFGFPADSRVPLPVQNISRAWQRAEFGAVSSFTHVLIEAERSLFGGLFNWDVSREADELRLAGASVALICHGTDIRSPRRHLTLTEWSPFADDPRRTAELQGEVDRNAALLSQLGLPVFVSTPDLLLDEPNATWCPVVIDVEIWASPTTIFQREVPVVLHTPSAASIKGTHLIEPTMRRLHEEGVIEYRALSGIKAEEMPDVVSDADIVLDQFRLGSYGVAACEAMAAGRLVVGHVLPQVREAVAAEAKLPLPIVEATPDSLEGVIRELVRNRARASATAGLGPSFVRKVHGGTFSAQVLVDRWIAQS